MKIILDTDRKTITVPYNYANKLAEINRIVQEYGGRDAEQQTCTGYIDKIWKECIADPDRHMVTARKPDRSRKPGRGAPD